MRSIDGSNTKKVTENLYREPENQRHQRFGLEGENNGLDQIKKNERNRSWFLRGSALNYKLSTGWENDFN